MDTKIFKTIDDIDLIIKSRKSTIIFEIGIESKKYKFRFEFAPKVFSELLNYLEKVAKQHWVNLKPKEAISMSSDYAEYYDKELDSNGYLIIENNLLFIERPSLDSKRLFKFNKGKIEAFIYDFRKIINLRRI